MIDLIKTKLFIPHARMNPVQRPRLDQQLSDGLSKKLTLVAAPAGFGKTTLLCDWILHRSLRAAWLSLDKSDNDSTRFWAYFISSLRQLYPQLCVGVLSLMQSPQPPALHSILTALINELSAITDEVVIILDDYHLIDSQSIHEAFIFLVAHMPENLHLVVTTRADPPLPLARLRARDQLTEIRANDLRFTIDEAASFLTEVMGVKLSAEEVAALEARTEGWIAGLQIAALSMRGRDNLPEFIESFSGSHRLILEYLAEEVLNQQPEGRVEFLLKTSILNRLNGSLCDALTGGSDGQEILEDLVSTNLFINPIDDQGIWYRYHHLFAEVLQVRLNKNHPDLVAELHRRASGWHSQLGIMDEAVRHALAGEDVDEAARLIGSVAGNMLRQGESVSLTGWLNALPEEFVFAHPRLSLVRGWTYFMGANFSLELAEKWAQASLRGAEADGSLDAELAGEVDALLAMIAVTRGEVRRSLELARQALNTLPEESPWLSAIVFCLGTAHYLAGDIAAAAPVLKEAIRLSQEPKENYIRLAAASFLGEILVLQGQLDRAGEWFEQVLEWADPELPQKGGVMAYGGLANILCERDCLQAAQDQIHLGMRQLEQLGGAWSTFVLFRSLARVYAAGNEWTHALEILQRARQLGEEAQLDLVVTQAAALCARLNLASGDLFAAESWAMSCGLHPDDEQANHPGSREVEYLTLARVLRKQGRHGEALSLLDRLLQAAQAEDRKGSVIAILIVKSCLLQEKGDTAAALVWLEHALTLAEPEGYFRIFVEEGALMRTLLLRFRAHLQKYSGGAANEYSVSLLDYTKKLLAALPRPSPPVGSQQEPLLGEVSERELEVLYLINEGLTNQEIADQLVIAVSTVKTHINHLYGKFGVRSRTQVLATARQLGLLPD